MRYAGWAVALIVGGLWFFSPDPPPTYRIMEVPVTAIQEVERVDTVVTVIERIRWREAEPETVATASEGAVGLVHSFCAPSLAATGAPGGTGPVTPVRPTLLLRSVTTDDGWFFQPDKVTLTGPTSTGDLRQFRYSVRPGWRAHVRGEDVLVQSDRWWWVKDGLEAAVFVGLGYLVGSL